MLNNCGRIQKKHRRAVITKFGINEKDIQKYCFQNS